MTPRKLASNFLNYVKYADCMDDFFCISEKGTKNNPNSARKDLAWVVCKIRSSKIEAGIQLGREYWYSHYYMWTGGGKSPIDEHKYTTEFEKVITDSERLFSWQ